MVWGLIQLSEKLKLSQTFLSTYLWSFSYLAKIKGLLIKIKVIKGFLAKLKVLKDFNQNIGF